MKKRSKILIGLVMALSFMLVLTACGKEAEKVDVTGEYLGVIDLEIPTKGTMPADVTVTLNADNTCGVHLHIYDPLQGKYTSTYTSDGNKVTIAVPEIVQAVDRTDETYTKYEDSDQFTSIIKDMGELTITIDKERGEFELAG